MVLEDLPLADAAAVLGITPSAAKSRMHRARARLRRALASDDVDLPTRREVDA